MHEFQRITRLPPYVFAQVDELKLAARRRGDDIIDFGMGNPDLPTPPHIVEKLVEAAFLSLRTKKDNRITPAMAAGIASQPWSIEQVLGLLDSTD